MLESRWLLLVVGATLCLLSWLVVLPSRRVYFSAGFGGILYGAAFFAAPGVERLTESGETVAAPVGPVLQYLMLVLAVLSLTVLFLRRFGYWPPEPEKQPEEIPS